MGTPISGFGALTMAPRIASAATDATRVAAKKAYTQPATFKMGDNAQVSHEAQLKNLQHAATSQKIQRALPQAQPKLVEQLARLASQDRALIPPAPGSRAKLAATTRQTVSSLTGGEKPISSFNLGNERKHVA